LRFSFGAFNDSKDVDYALTSLNKIIERMWRVGQIFRKDW
jgi:cysteine sulfinate desulfinase/cysteine desulfurase-like protein